VTQESYPFAEIMSRIVLHSEDIAVDTGLEFGKPKFDF
jgi:hypothetical protein